MSSGKNDWREEFDKLYSDVGNFIHKHYVNGPLKNSEFTGEDSSFSERDLYEFMEAMGENIDEYDE